VTIRREGATAYRLDMTVRGVLFDFGNTLFAHAPLDSTIAGAAERLGLVITAAEASDLATRIDALAAGEAEAVHRRDLDAAVWTTRWHHLYGVDDHRWPGLGAALYAAMHDPTEWFPYADTAAVLTVLHDAGIRVGVVSNTGWDVRAVFAEHQLHTAVDAFALSCECGVAKPDRAIFAIACAGLGVEPAEVVMVGDDARADVGGTALGIRTLLLPATPPGTDNGLTGAAALAVAGRSAPAPGGAR
jgi:putative hydrolase of the HAD superfamily